MVFTKYELHLENINEDTDVEFICDIKTMYLPFYIEPLEKSSVMLHYAPLHNGEILSYSFDTVNWMNLPSNMEISVEANQRMYICAKQNMNRFVVYNSQEEVTDVFNEYGKTSYAVGGNIMSLLYTWGNKFGQKTLNTSNRECFIKLFCNSRLLNADNLLLPENVAKGCYAHMFENTEIRKSPLLKAQTLEAACYESLFRGCSSLNEITCRFTEWTGYDTITHERVNCTKNWVENVAPNGTFHAVPDLDTTHHSIDMVPNGWTVATNIE